MALLHRPRNSKEGDGATVSPGAVHEQLQSFVFAFTMAPLPTLAVPSAQLPLPREHPQAPATEPPGVPTSTKHPPQAAGLHR